MKLYLAGPMRGIPQFNFPAFHAAEAALQAQGHEVFSPARADERRHGAEFSLASPDGDIAKASEAGFFLRAALGEDLDWICEHAEGIALLPGWEMSAGAKAEWATAAALGLKFIYL